MIIAIDGLGINGKSTLAKMISTTLGFKYYNSGAVYRCIALEIVRRNLDINNIKDTIMQIQSLEVDFENDKVLLNGEDVTNDIKSVEFARKAAEWSNIEEITQFVRQKQKEFLAKNNTVIEGRDIGARIAPNAEIKFYLYSDIETRTQRVWEQDKSLDRDEVKNIILERDRIEIEGGSYIKPENSIEIDTSNLTIDEVYNKMMEEINRIILSNYYKC